MGADVATGLEGRKADLKMVFTAIGLVSKPLQVTCKSDPVMLKT